MAQPETLVPASTSGLGYTSGSAPAASPASAVRTRTADELEIRLEFGGGLHLIFSQQPKHTIFLPRTTPGADARPADIRYLIAYMKDNLVSEREDMFVDGEGVRPGILVLINDADWELEGELDYVLQDRDEIVFISTLHGG
ncbi:Ubiquitin- modifier 1 [Apiotrichum porosum]|uniref:Ubiquitin-related modifier 1 n=1 Tax=Apiotrichum porosum TaxID=105984 RepID=A0A427Y6Y4_9TREE|nr:Ubiquitin- modifier 1 [Apiotrichum porosum]RSH86851.1 Ubiquitin- modifier 1 [Apiotrichum porosum]